MSGAGSLPHLTEKISGVKRDHTKDIDGVKHDLADVKQDVRKLLTGDVAWMQAVLQDRQPPEYPTARSSPAPPSS